MRRHSTTDAVSAAAADTEKQRGGRARQCNELENRELLGTLAFLKIIRSDSACRFALCDDIPDDFQTKVNDGSIGQR